MWEVYDGKVRAFEGGYSAYMLERVQRQQANAKAEQRRRNIARKELAWLSRGARARSTKPKFHVKLARELIANEPPLRDSIELKRASVARLGKQVVDLLGASLCYPGKIVLEPCDWSIGAGERIGILGANGSGKTSLLKLIDASLAPSSGTVKIGASVRFGTMTQEQHELKPYADSQVLELLAECKGSYLVDGKELTPAKLLENLGFERKHLLSRVADLSGGLRRRLQLLLTLLAMPNFLILDEPGNDLDTDMLAVTESLLDSWPGTLILVSHDRYLLERVTDMQYAIIDGKLRHLPAGVEQYLQLTADTPPMQATRQESTKQTTGKATGQESTATGGHKKGDKKSEATKSKQVNSYQLAKDLASTERKLDTLAKKQTALIEQMHETNPSDYLELVRLGEAQEQLKREINSLEEHWYQLNEQL
jgi:ATPase subunit of ABC transporter with duplicated ATPase domains